MKIILVFLLFLSGNAVLSKEFNTKPKHIESIETPQGYKNIEFIGYSFSIPDKFVTKEFSKAKIEIREGKRLRFMLDIAPKKQFLFEGFKSRREYYLRLFDYSDVSHNELNKTRKMRFALSKNIEVYERDNFYFFRENYKSAPPYEDLKTTIVISSPKNDDMLTMIFPIDNEELIMNAVKSFKIKE